MLTEKDLARRFVGEVLMGILFVAVGVLFYLEWQAKHQDRWHRHDQQLWRDRLEHDNPTLKVPPAETVEQGSKKQPDLRRYLPN